MLKRKKRIPYDPPGSKPRGKKAASNRRVDQIFLTRRVFLVKTAVIGGFAVLTARLAQMQLMKGQQYQAQARTTTSTGRSGSRPAVSSTTLPAARSPRICDRGKS